MNYTRSVDVGSIDFFYYNPVEQSLLDPFSTTIPGIGPLSAVEVIRTNLYWGEFESINDHYADGITPNPDDRWCLPHVQQPKRHDPSDD